MCDLSTAETLKLIQRDLSKAILQSELALSEVDVNSGNFPLLKIRIIEVLWPIHKMRDDINAKIKSIEAANYIT